MTGMEQSIAPSSSRRYTLAEYDRICDGTDARLDYWEGVITDREGTPITFDPAGRVLDMAGASPDHGRIEQNIAAEVRLRLRGTPCEGFGPSVQVRLGRQRLYAHPDYTVVCGEVQLDPDQRNGRSIPNPRLVFEVLSPSTQDYDRNAKAEGYREVASLQEYVLVSQDRPRVEVFYRSADDVWSFGRPVTDLSASVHLRSVDVDLPMAEVYARVVFPPAPTRLVP